MSVATSTIPDTAPEEGRTSDEGRLARGAVLVLGLLAVPILAVTGFIAGWPGVAAALVGLSFVFLLFGASAVMLLWTARRGKSGIVILTVGALIRLPLYFVILRLLEDVPWIHGRSLAATTAIAVGVTLAYELRLMAKMPHLFWVDASAARPTSTATNDTRSQSL